jgi:hypothetical protein
MQHEIAIQHDDIARHPAGEIGVSLKDQQVPTERPTRSQSEIASMRLAIRHRDRRSTRQAAQLALEADGVAELIELHHAGRTGLSGA